MSDPPQPRSQSEAARTANQPDGFEGLTIVLSVEDDGWLSEGLGDLEPLMRRCLVATARRVGMREDVRTELSATFTSDAEVAAINAEWRGKDQPTNVLSFPIADLAPGDVPGAMLGDVVFARETLIREAAAEHKSLHDHLCHLVVHGFMHCLGFDHVEATEAEAMERLETAILADLGIPDPYAMMDRDGAAPERLAS